jgi:hypothetical protein
VGLATPVLGVHLLAVGQLDDEAFQPGPIQRRSILVENSEAPDNLFQVLELVIQHADRTGRTRLATADHVALEEQLGGPADLRLRAIGQSECPFQQSAANLSNIIVPVGSLKGACTYAFSRRWFLGPSGGAAAGRDAHSHAGKARAQRSARAFPPRDGAPGLVRQAERQDAHAVMRIGRGAHLDRRQDGRHIGRPQRADAGAERGVGAVARIDQHDTGRNTGRQGGANLRQRDLRLGKRIASGTCALSRRSASSAQSQIQPIGDR